MQVLPPVSGEDDSTTEEEEEEEEVVEEEVMEEVVEEEEEVPVEREDQCKKKLEEAKALSKSTLCTFPPVEQADKLCSHSS